MKINQSAIDLVRLMIERGSMVCPIERVNGVTHVTIDGEVYAIRVTRVYRRENLS
jgi:hypothetical protein